VEVGAGVGVVLPVEAEGVAACRSAGTDAEARWRDRSCLPDGPADACVRPAATGPLVAGALPAPLLPPAVAPPAAELERADGRGVGEDDAGGEWHPAG